MAYAVDSYCAFPVVHRIQYPVGPLSNPVAGDAGKLLGSGRTGVCLKVVEDRRQLTLDFLGKTEKFFSRSGLQLYAVGQILL